MARAPRVGAGKQRLAASIGRAAAWRINRALQAHTLRTACDRRWRSLLCVAPDGAVSLQLPNVWPARVVRVPQGRGDLGERMARMLGLCGRRERVAIIGVDCPGITRGRIASAFEALGRRRFAIGPSPDGGFWILATREPHRTAQAFRGVRWSTPYALADVVDRLPEAPAMLSVLRDVDTIEDWRNAGPPPWR
jgi:rSAM/selenodomain-associated transferase 1